MKSVFLFITLASIVACLPPKFLDPSLKGQMRLIEFNETYRTWMSLKDVEEHSRECDKRNEHGGFIDVTDYPDMSPDGLASTIKQRLQALAFPSRVTHQAIVDELLPHLKIDQLREYDTTLSSFKTRKYDTADGEKAAHYIRDKFIQYSSGRSDVSVELFPHSWRQPSVIARIAGQGDHADEVVIIGAHEDSISSTTDAPGADDDASGTSCVLEVFRILCEQGFVPDRTVEFHTYSAEEVGLWGSQAIANKYQSQGVAVYAQMQLDMTMFVRSGTTETFGIITDYVNAGLTEFLKELVTAYSELGFTTSKCGYGCSDHASWTKAGYASCFPFEGTMANGDPYIHTKNDLISYLSLTHGMEFSKVATGFIVELSLL